LNVLIGKYNIGKEDAKFAMSEFERKVRQALINGIREMDVTQEIRQLMSAAIRGALEKLFVDLEVARTGDNIIDFVSAEMYGYIASEVEAIIRAALTGNVPDDANMDENFIDALLTVTGEQVQRPGGIDF
jgi:hypothetical protein